MSQITIKAPAKSSFNISISNGFNDFSEHVANLNLENNKIALITENKIWSIYKDSVLQLFNDLTCDINLIEIDDINNINSLSDVEFIYDQLSGYGINSTNYIISLGGSIVTSLTGFIASTYNGGIPLIHIPTTIFAMCDSCISGKTSVNNRSNNSLSNYYYPKYVYINIDLLNTLDDIHYYSGFAHIMRTAIIKSTSVYEWLIENLYEICDKDSHIISDMIEQTINIERVYIERDLNCTNDRLVLGLGNTIAEAIEKHKNYDITYGECLALGIICAAHISLKKNMLSLDEYLEIRDMFVPFNLPITIENVKVEDIINLIPNESGLYTFVLLKKIGKAVIDKTITADEVKAALDEIYFDEENMME